MTTGRTLLVGLSLSLSAACSSAQTIPAEEFERCLADFGTKARAEGVSEATVEDSLGQVAYSERVLELDRQQPEFTTTFTDYFGKRVNELRVAQGRILLARHRELLEGIAKEYGVPAPYLVAFWGLETNYGSFFGKMSVLDSLATLACDQRRSEYFTRELMAALSVIDEGAITPDNMEGSWAGAMGHVQFMPSVFVRYAVDYDDDGRRDLWNSLPDAMASAANFLSNLGWDPDTRWGREVQLPDSFPYLQAGLDTRKSLAAWSELGVRRADGSPLPRADMQASLLVPSGHKGPAFLVYDNFKAIMGWNRSEFYALAVGHMADRIAGGSRLSQQPPDDAPRLSRDQVMALQAILNREGFDAGEPDGILGPATRRALRSFQDRHDMVADGFPSQEVLAQLGIES